jgi:uncharacterized protein (TIGR04141 family)
MSVMTYLAYVESSSGQIFLNLDRIMIRTKLPSGDYFQACDLLGPNNELVYVERPHSSARLSHLFNEALVACELLSNVPEAREALMDAVERIDGTRMLPAIFRPSKIVFALGCRSSTSALSEDLLELIYPFSQIPLVSVAKELKSNGIDVEVIGIPTYVDDQGTGSSLAEF